jgi:lipid-binding SYLF domain-containing protein
MTASGKTAMVLGVVVSLLLSSPVGAQSREESVVQAADVVLQEIMAIPVKQIPKSLLADAQGLVIIPNLVKGGFVIGIKHGRGVALVRDEVGAWKPPLFVTMTGGSVGWQAGLQATDVVLVFKTQKSVRGLMNGKFTIGADAAAAAGPVGREAAAATDATLKAEILSYSRSRGLFAGVALDGSVLQVDAAANQTYYASTGYTPQGTPFGQAAQLPTSSRRLMEQVARYTAGSTTGVAAGAASRPTAGTPATPASSPAGAMASSSGVAALVAPAEAVLRRELATTLQQLQPLLDENWRRYLAVPAEVFAGNNPPTPESLNSALARFDVVARDPRYIALSQRPEFQAAHTLLKKYASSRAAMPPPSLPPPPAGVVQPLRPPRY